MAVEQLTLMPATIRGEIRHVVFETADGGYAVIRVVDDDGVESTVVGPMNTPSEGQTIEVTGRWEKHAEYGRQLRAETYSYTLPATKQGLIRFLSSGAIPGVGKTIASRIVAHFGADALQILDSEPKRLTEVDKIGRKKAAAIAAAWRESSGRRAGLIYLQGLGISPAYCSRLYKRYGESCVEVIKENPYRLAEEVDGIGFARADAIAQNLGIAPDSDYRMTAAAVFIVNTACGAGHVGYPEHEVVAKAVELTGQSGEAAARGIGGALERKLLVRGDDLLYLPFMAHAEKALPLEVKRLAAAGRFSGSRLRFASGDPKLKLSDEQAAAVERSWEKPLGIITGGPGVGKTTVVGEIVRRAKEVKLKLALAAPTGRAAKRLSECTGETAKTLHRLLQFDPASGRFVHDNRTPLPFDLIIVDEVSMLDINLALALFRAVRTGASLILVGDSDQLPSVGPGTVLADFLASGWFLTTCLTRIFRQGAASMIIANAHAVNRGMLPCNGESGDGKLTDFYWIEQDDPEKVIGLIDRMLTERIPQRFGLDPVTDCQVLSPMNRNSCGTVALNAHLQELFNGADVPEFRFGERRFKLNDKVMQTSNNYDKNVFNGDMGRIVSLSTRSRKMQLLFDDGRRVEYDFSEADQLTLAYAVTVHKSQGSEFPAVILPLLTQHYMMLQRNLLYTAMTRARKLLILIGSEKALKIAVGNFHVEVRYSHLRDKLMALKNESPQL